MRTGQDFANQNRDPAELVLRGASICPGIGIGRVHIVDPDLHVTSTELTPRKTTLEKQRYTSAVKATKRRLREQARECGRDGDVMVCGESAADTRVFPHLVRMGYHSFSIAPVSAPIFRGTCSTLRLDTEGEKQR